VRRCNDAPKRHNLIDPSLFTLLFRRWDRHSALSKEEREAFSALPFVRKTLPKDAYLVEEGRPTSECTLLLQGFAYRHKLVHDGARQIISIHIPGEFIDLQHLMLATADHNVQTLSKTEIASVPAAALRDIGARYPALQRAIWLDLLIDASIFREWVVNVGRRDARTRIAHLLCELALRLDASGTDTSPTYEFPLTQDQLADATGLTPVHTNRTLQSLRKDGLIALSSSRLTVLDWDALRDAGDFSERYLHHAVRHPGRS